MTGRHGSGVVIQDHHVRDERESCKNGGGQAEVHGAQRIYVSFQLRTHNSLKGCIQRRRKNEGRENEEVIQCGEREGENGRSIYVERRGGHIDVTIEGGVRREEGSD